MPRQDGSRALREAATLAPQNRKVKDAFLQIQSQESVHILKRLCSRFVLEADAQAGKDALNYLARSGQVPPDIAEECFTLVLGGLDIDGNDTQDGIISALLRQSLAARTTLAKQLQESTTVAFDKIYEIGDDSANQIVTVVLDPPAWASDSVRWTCEHDVFQLFLAKLMGIGHDLRALKGISRLLATNAAKLSGLVDEHIFSAILVCLDNRLPIEVRSQATLATAKYLEAAEDKGQLTLSNFISTRVTRHNAEDLVLAFSAAAAMFPLVPSIASALFLTEGFLPSLIPLLEKRSRSEKVETAALDMLSAACVDTTCREAIKKHCTGWLQRVVDAGKDQRPGRAAVILAKVRSSSIHSVEPKREDTQARENGVDDLVPMFKRIMVDDEGTDKQNAIEGLAYASVQSHVKERLSSDKDFLKKFLLALRDGQSNITTIYGGLTIIDHLTRYLPVLSEEQKRLAQLKAYANASKGSSKPDILDEDVAVTKRCAALVQAGVMSTLVEIGRSISTASAAIVLNIVLSISKNSSHRGIIAQQGGIKLLLQLYTSITGQTAAEAQSRRIAAHALARILISVNPTLVFASGSPPVTSVIRPLTLLLTEDSDHFTEGPRDLLPTFESLLALTNLASAPSPEAAEAIIRLSFPTIEELLLGTMMIQRASTELVCNLMNCSSGLELFADNSKAAARRLHILLALADVEDDAIRRAAGGALATITEFEGAVQGIVARDRGVEILLGLCEDADEGILHRGVVCVRNIVWADTSIRAKARASVKDRGGVGILKETLQRTKNMGVLEIGIEALKGLA